MPPVQIHRVMAGLLLIPGLLLFESPKGRAQSVWLDETDLSAMQAGWGTPSARKSVDGNPLSVGGKKFERGIGTHAISTFLLHPGGKGRRFTASVGVDDEAGPKASLDFCVLGDGKVLWDSGVMKKGDVARNLDIDIGRVKLLGLLVTDAGDGIDYDHADWCDARLQFAGGRIPEGLAVPAPAARPYVLTPRASGKPHLNGARVFGVRPGHPLLYTIAATGDRPMTFETQNLPRGLTMDPATGRITGLLEKRGDYTVRLIARNALGKAEQTLLIIAGDEISLTPPMGWNSWNCWAEAVDDDRIRAAADAMVKTGLVNHGWVYINIDDCWMVKPEAGDPALQGEPRDTNGMINTNKKFPDMGALAGYVHERGLKLGMYSSPGPLTCAGYTASYLHEDKDAERFGEWGVDYLKYDWCSYGKIAKDKSVAELQKPYVLMRKSLDRIPRDIVFSLCQYGMGKVWEWGAGVGGNCWRTTGDITDSWGSMSGIGFSQAGHETFASPGHWNDPDMLVVGNVGWGPSLHPSRLTPDEQYTHMSLWCLLSAPLLIGCDLSALDEFTLGLLSNDEVLGVDQDPLGRQASRLSENGGRQTWVKDMEDGSKAVGLFNTGESQRKPADYFAWTKKKPSRMILKGSDLGFTKRFRVRDLWRQKDLGVFEREFTTAVPYHGIVFVRVWQQ